MGTAWHAGYCALVVQPHSSAAYRCRAGLQPAHVNFKQTLRSKETWSARGVEDFFSLVRQELKLLAQRASPLKRAPATEQASSCFRSQPDRAVRAACYVPALWFRKSFCHTRQRVSTLRSVRGGGRIGKDCVPEQAGLAVWAVQTVPLFLLWSRTAGHSCY